MIGGGRRREPHYWGLITEDSSSSSTRADSNHLRSPDPTNKDISLCFSSSLYVYGSSVLAAKRFFFFLSCHSFTVVPVVLAELQQYTVSPNGVQSRGILSLWLSWKWRLTVKVHAGKDGCYFLLNSFTADDVLRGVTAAALTAKDES